MKQTVGNVDFFPNGGEKMPGCDKMSFRFEDLDNMIAGNIVVPDYCTLLSWSTMAYNCTHLFSELHEKVFCNHQMSVQFFTGSVLKPDGLIGYPASSYSAFQEVGLNAAPPP